MLNYNALLLTILSITLYQVVQKNMPAGLHPLLALLVAYLTAAGLCLALLLIFPVGTPLLTGLRALNWTSFALAFAIVGIEAGFLLAYRAGWGINLVGLLANTASALLILPVGIFYYREQLSLYQSLGILLCLVGLVLIHRG